LVRLGGDKQGDKALIEFTRRVIALRREQIVFHRNQYFRGQTIPGLEVKDVGVRLSGEARLMHLTVRGVREPDDTFLIFMNASP
jgi:isoamylase